MNIMLWYIIGCYVGHLGGAKTCSLDGIWFGIVVVSNCVGSSISCIVATLSGLRIVGACIIVSITTFICVAVIIVWLVLLLYFFHHIIIDIIIP